jgi:hypothetical protein
MRSFMLRAFLGALVLMVVGCRRAADARASAYPRGAANYRQLNDTDFCSELPLFVRPNPDTMIGTVLDGAEQYIDPKTGQRFRAISVLTVVNGQRVDRWYRREQLVGHVYVLTTDPRLNNCGYWLDRTDPVRPLPSEIAAD